MVFMRIINRNVNYTFDFKFINLSVFINEAVYFLFDFQQDILSQRIKVLGYLFLHNFLIFVFRNQIGFL